MERLKRLNKKNKLEYHKNRKSERWMKLNNKYKKGIEHAKHSFYDKNIKKLRHTKTPPVVLNSKVSLKL